MTETEILEKYQEKLNAIADEVLLGKWGDGEARKIALATQGIDYKEVQTIVNRKLTKTSARVGMTPSTSGGLTWYYKEGVGVGLTTAQTQQNVQNVYQFFKSYGLTIEAICGILGNMEAESAINPGNKQTSSESDGWGLIQWTPATVLTNWCKQYGYTWTDGTAQCYRIICEGDGSKGAGGYWLPTSRWKYSWKEFCKLTSISDAVQAYLYERERPLTPNPGQRINYANKWYTFLTGALPPNAS